MRIWITGIGLVSPLARGAGGAISRDSRVGYAAVAFRDVATAEANAGVIKRLVWVPAAGGIRVYTSGTPALNAEIQPQFARIAEASSMTMKVVLRDENPDIMDEFLLNGRARAIPVAIFYTRDHQYITHWTERPAVAHAEVARIRGEFSAVHPTVDLKALTSADMPTVKTFFDARLPQHYPAWQVETVREIRDLLAAARAAA